MIPSLEGLRLKSDESPREKVESRLTVLIAFHREILVIISNSETAQTSESHDSISLLRV